MELGGVPQKNNESSLWDLYSMYVVLQGIKSYMYKGICVIHFGEGAATLDV